MEALYRDKLSKSLEMATEDHYRRQAEFYRSSPAYIRMIDLYPTLESSIKDCKNEKLIT